jgi:hypothetical protein
MWYKNKLHTYYDSLTRTKKLLISIVVLLVILVYIWPSWLSFGKIPNQELLMPHRWLSATARPLDQSDICLESKLQQYSRDADTLDVIINHSPLLPHEKYYFPFVGNGYIASAVSSSCHLYIKNNNGQTISNPVHFFPIVDISLEGFHSSEAHVIHLLDGVVHRIQCFLLQTDACVTVKSTVYAHRTRPSCLVQELRIHNPTDHSVTLEVRQVGVSGWSDAKIINSRITTGRSTNLEYTLVSGTASVSSHLSYAVVIAYVKQPESITVKANSIWSTSVVTFVSYEVGSTAGIQNKIQQLVVTVQKEFAEVMNIETKALRLNHSAVWTGLWSSGFRISYSMANGALNGDKINMTMYNVLSHASSPIFELKRPESEKLELERLLYFPDRCYEGHHTLQNVKMWPDFNKIEDVFESASMWLLTLEKQGCATMLQAGADGVLQAMMLSCGGLKFTNHHLEFGTHPRDLHRDYYFRRINYGNDTHVNISVQVGDDNKAALYVSLDRNNRSYYACDAGCLDSPEPLSREVCRLPVKLTDPVTPILYITADKQHMEQLKHTIHVRQIIEAPPHEQHVMVLHKHGHNFGGLPMLFWGTIGLLIFVFHLFLFKLIYNEYCSGSESSQLPRYNRHSGRYV